MTITPATTPDMPTSRTLPDTPPAIQGAYWESQSIQNTATVLTSTECWALAATQSAGRLGFFREGLLDIFPVNYFVRADHVYFRTSAGGTIATSYLEHAAFQIDQVDREARSGWTVLLNGPATRVEDPSLLTTLWGKAVDEPWAPGQRNLFFELTPSTVRGRQMGATH
ncbi:pyridoxamine 5'-phosphate oxidase family protein [Arthrobacter agilis]|uniref:Pyridoxamine 5'-phosphate oxidase family protein n=1 Tax=Arthrobacter agilis TaxID=37921 RepID=A0A2L0UHH9_9MICC|nr:pyridoxamine 5'-phosphate oxidase family protein [Arthrobacter agilis]AUZ88695.1 pyridoxamine 5'-phosphate oxidase family protein [Arthrobacter agilis]